MIKGCVTPKWSYDLLNLVVVEQTIWKGKKNDEEKKERKKKEKLER